MSIYEFPNCRRKIHAGAFFLCVHPGCEKRYQTLNAVLLHRSTVGHNDEAVKIIEPNRVQATAEGDVNGGGDFECAQVSNISGSSISEVNKWSYQELLAKKH